MDYWWLFEKLVLATMVVGGFMSMIAFVVWVERRACAFIQDRLGPNRIRIFGIPNFGLLQGFADALKLLLKEDLIPRHSRKLLFALAPALLLIPVCITASVIPFGPDFKIFGRTFSLQIADLDVGVVFVLALASLGVYGLIIAGWASGSKYPMLGGIRAAAQLISCETAMALSVLGVVLAAGTADLRAITADQQHLLFGFIPKWGIVYQPLGFLLFLICAFAECHRLPFDLPEGESELVGGFHTEYSSMKFSMFFMSEYVALMVSSGILVTLFLGGYSLPWITPETIVGWLGASGWASTATALLHVGVFCAKAAFVVWFFVWVRWTLPRFRYDQLMRLSWRILLPLSVANLIVTALVLAFFR